MSESVLPQSLVEYLKEFELVAHDGAPFITIDRQRRFYIPAAARRLLDIKPGDIVLVAYNAKKSSVAIVKSSSEIKESGGALASASFKVDKRYYISARLFCNEYGFYPEDAPYYFDFVRSERTGRAFVFRLRTGEAPSGINPVGRPAKALKAPKQSQQIRVDS